MQFSNTLKNRRTELHMTQQQLADSLFVTRQTVSRWENNLSYPNLDTLVEISDLLNLPLDDLLRGDSSTMVTNISNDVRLKTTYQRYAIITSAILGILVFIFFGFGWGRYTQNQTIDHLNPFLATNYGYGVLPKNSHAKTDTYISDDPFGNGEWLKFKTGGYDKENRWVMVSHKGSSIRFVRTISYDEIPLTYRKQVGKTYFAYHKADMGPRISKKWRWSPFN